MNWRMMLAMFSTLFLNIGSAAEFQRLWNANLTPHERDVLLDALQSCSDKTPTPEFLAFDASVAASSRNPLLLFYDDALKRLLKMIPEQQVRPGEVVIFYLYNMGYVIKTPTACFGIDLHHRSAAELAPFLDFLLITHNHSDHWSLPLLKVMRDRKKPIVSNFFPDNCYSKESEKTFVLNGITVHCYEADHKATLKKFTMPMEIICPTGNSNFVLFTSGDCACASQLHRKSDVIDLYLVHPRCGMPVMEAVERLDPRYTMISHLQELSHEVGHFRWPYSVGREEVENLKKAGRNGCFPVWGEVFVWDESVKLLWK